LWPALGWMLEPILAQVLQPERLTKQQTEERVFWSREILLANEGTLFRESEARPG